jgi:diamine N-acetyltransferase
MRPVTLPTRRYRVSVLTVFPAEANQPVMDKDLQIRRATVDDAAVLADLGARTFSETFAADNSEENMSAYLAEAFNLEQQTLELNDPNAVVLLAENGRVASGYSIIRVGHVPDEVTGPDAVELVRLYVTKDSWGTGVGPALMASSIREAQELGFRTVWLGVWENNHRAQAFYRKWGFEVVGTHVFQLGDDPQTDFLMQRPIS